MATTCITLVVPPQPAYGVGVVKERVGASVIMLGDVVAAGVQVGGMVCATIGSDGPSGWVTKAR